MTAINLAPSAAIPARYANRHCLITGPTGAGKSVSLMRLCEQFSRAESPVVLFDVKGDLAALSRSCPAVLLDPFAPSFSIPVWHFGPDLMARALELSEAQTGAVEIAFAWADETGAPLDTLSHFRAILAVMAANPDSVAHLGHVTRASIGTIQRALLAVERQGAASLFGAMPPDLQDMLTPGRVTIIDAAKLIEAPRLYGAVMLWLLREVAERMPEAGDLATPRLVLALDEAHALFNEAPKALIARAESTARLVRSKGVALIWASQNPLDIPRVIVDQCAHKVVHARELGVGVAHFQTLTPEGRQTHPRLIRPELPTCRPGALSDAEKAALGHASAPQVETAASPEAPMTWHGIAFLAACAVILPALGFAAWWTLANGHGGAVAAWTIGAALAIRKAV